MIWLLVFILAALAVTAAVEWNLGYGARRADEEAEALRDWNQLQAHRATAEVFDQEAPPRLTDFVAAYAEEYGEPTVDEVLDAVRREKGPEAAELLAPMIEYRRSDLRGIGIPDPSDYPDPMLES